MKITLDKGQLQKRLKVIERIIPKKAGLPFHYAVYIVADTAGAVTLWASNAREEYVARLVAMGDHEDGMAAIPAQELIRAVAAAPGATVTIVAEVGGTRSRVESGTARWNLEGLAGVVGQDAPLPIQTEDRDEINQAELVRVLETTRYAASKSESRPSFQQLHVGEGRVVAADGRRVHQETLGPVGGATTFDIPERNVDTLLEALNAEGVPGPVFVATDADSVQFSFGTMRYRVGRLNYPFPDINSIVLERARAQKGVVTASLGDLVTAVKVAGVAVEDGGAVQLAFTNGVIEVSGHSQRSEGRMEVRASTSKEITDWGKNKRAVLSVRADDFLEALGRVVTAEDGRFQFTVMAVEGDPGWVYISSPGGSMEAAIRPVVV